MLKHFKFISRFSLLYLLCCCGPPEFERNTRIQVMGEVEDQNGQAITGTEVSVFTESGYGLYTFSGQDRFLLGEGLSDDAGRFSVTSLFDQDADFYVFFDGKDVYANYVYATNTINYTPSDNTFDLEVVVLRELANVNFNITRTSPPGTEFNFSYKLQDSYCFETFIAGILDPSQSQCYLPNYSQSLLNDDRPDYNQTHRTLLGSTLEFTYSVNNGPEITETITINQVNYDFEFTY